MKPPILVFTDDLDIFSSPESVTSYFEAWIVEEKCEAFDSEGRVINLNITNVQKKFLGLIPYNLEILNLKETEVIKKDELEMKVREYLKAFPDMSYEKRVIFHSDLKKLSFDELLILLTEIKGLTK